MLLEKLSENEQQLQKFTKNIVGCQSIGDFKNLLQIAVEQSLKPSGAYNQELALRSLEPGDLLNNPNISDALKVRTVAALDKLMPFLQEQFILKLREPALFKAETRLESALPIMEYLGRFSKEHQMNWGSEYIEEMDNLIYEISSELLVARLQSPSPFNLQHLNQVWNIAKNVYPPINKLDDTLRSVEKAISKSPEQRIRLLTKWQSWSERLPPDQKLPFLMSFCQVMEQFEEGENWDTFTNLVKQTQSWLNKGGEGKYIPAIINLWDKLSSRANELPVLSEFINWSNKLEGKSWYQVMQIGLNISTSNHLSVHLSQIQGCWKELTQGNGKKSEKNNQFSLTLQSLEKFYQLTEILPKGDQARLKKKLLLIPPERFMSLMELTQDNFL